MLANAIAEQLDDEPLPTTIPVLSMRAVNEPFGIEEMVKQASISEIV
jgi:hypothetical protein